MSIRSATLSAATVVEAASSKETILTDLCNMVAGALHIPTADLNVNAPFLEMGADSIVLIDVLRKVSATYNLKLSVRQFFEELATLDALAAFLAEQTPLPTLQSPGNGVVHHPKPPAMPPTTPPNDIAAPLPIQSALPGQASRTPLAGTPTAGNSQMTNAIERIMAQQLQVVSQVIADQLAFLAGNDDQSNEWTSATEWPAAEGENAWPVVGGPTPGELATNGWHEHLAEEVQPPHFATPTNLQSSPAQPPASVTPFVKPQLTEGAATSNLTDQQRAYLQTFVARYTARTPQSKAWVQTYRPVLADNRASAGFRPSIKEMLYPLVAQRSQGSHLWDIDGNDYVDIAMGFGVHLFGHQPAMVVEALQQQLRQGFQLGPQSYLAGQVAELIHELTGMERVAFNNSGTEAVMTALRLARTVTGRNKVAMFVGSYHGHYDGTLAAPDPHRLDGAAEPVAPGVTNNAVADVLIIPGYGEPAALEVIKAHAHELAVVVVEPVQSRRPDLQPVEFLRELRQLTQSCGVLLMFDEVITGFRIHPGGAQALFGVQADLVTYGKVVGGGLPIGVVAGKAPVLDALDGGMWRFGDASYPPSDTTFFAGTFCKHPLTMASAHAVLTHMQQQGPALQSALNARTAKFADTVNAFLAEQQVPIKVAHFGSLFYFRFQGNMDLFFYHLVEKGIYLWEGRTCFLSTAHTDADIDFIVQAIKSTVADLQQGGFFVEA